MRSCRYRENAAGVWPPHACTTTFGEPLHGDKECAYEMAAQVRDSRGDSEDGWARAMYVALKRAGAVK